MKKWLLIFISAGYLMSCNTNHSTTSLTPKEFALQIKENPTAVVLDVTTPEEFSNSHLQNAINIDWNGEHFDREIKKLNPETPVYVYCFSGARSASAASYLRDKGFKAVYELKGGLLQWRSEKLPETSNVEQQGMTLSDYQQILQNHNVVLVDFNATWCVPCQKMNPIIEKIAKENPSIKVLSIDVDQHVMLSQQLNITGIPAFKVYKKGKLTWEQIGMVSKETLEQTIR